MFYYLYIYFFFCYFFFPFNQKSQFVIRTRHKRSAQNIRNTRIRIVLLFRRTVVIIIKIVRAHAPFCLFCSIILYIRFITPIRHFYFYYYYFHILFFDYHLSRLTRRRFYSLVIYSRPTRAVKPFWCVSHVRACVSVTLFVLYVYSRVTGAKRV